MNDPLTLSLVNLQLILGDATEQFQLGYSSVAVFHPGPFHVDFSFVLYRPSTNTTEFSRVE